MKIRQTGLGFKLDDSFTFANFKRNSHNLQALCAIKSLERRPGVLWLSGAGACGKTHLLHAICHDFIRRGKSGFIIPLDKYENINPADIVPSNLPDVLCLDNFDKVGGDKKWEHTLFSLHNLVQDGGKSLVMTSKVSTADFVLPDLKSRLAGANRVRIPRMTDDELTEILKFRAKAAGIKLGDNLVRFIHNHYSRNLKDLILLLAKANDLTLEYQRKLDIKMVKKIIAELPTK